MGEHWTIEDLKAWTGALLKTHRVIAPVAAPHGPVWDEITSPEQVAWDSTRTAVSPRSWMLPRSEPLFSYDTSAGRPALTEPELDRRPTVLLLLRPCDVAGLRALDPVMRWDYQDEPYEARRAATLLVALACREAASSGSCFCEAVGLDPGWAGDADVIIERIDGLEDVHAGGAQPGPAPAGGARATGEAPRYRIFALTDRGRERLAGSPRPAPNGGADGPVSGGGPRSGDRPAVTQPVEIEAARGWMRGHFEDPIWARLSESCLGCGACAFVCPTCHCFDVVDEGDWRRGTRVRNWDSCAFGHFTLHASGHNPRPAQWNRYRQRLFHKYVYYPDKFGRLLCTGCGRCIDACPAGMDLIEVLQALVREAAKEPGAVPRPGVPAPSAASPAATGGEGSRA